MPSHGSYKVANVPLLKFYYFLDSLNFLIVSHDCSSYLSHTALLKVFTPVHANPENLDLTYFKLFMEFHGLRKMILSSSLELDRRCIPYTGYS